MNTYDVRQYGAVGDGVTDDHRAVAAAIQAIPQAGGTLYFPSGRYQINNVVDIDKPVSFICDHDTTLSRASMGFMFRARSSRVAWRGFTFKGSGSSGQHVVAYDIPATERRGNSDWLFEDCLFEFVCLTFTATDRVLHNGQVQTAGSDIIDGIRVTRCIFQNGRISWGVQLGGVTNAVIDSCTFRNWGVSAEDGDMVKVTAGSRDVRIVNNHFASCTRDAIDCFDASDVTIAGNSIRNMAGQGIDAKWYATCANNTNHLIIANNQISGCVNGIAASVNQSSVSGNHVSDCETGILVTNPYPARTTDTNVNGNVVLNCRSQGISYFANNGTISGNTVRDSKEWGVVLGGTGLSVHGNHAYGSPKGDFVVRPACVAKFWGNHSGDGSGADTVVIAPA